MTQRLTRLLTLSYSYLDKICHTGNFVKRGLDEDIRRWRNASDSKLGHGCQDGYKNQEVTGKV